MQISCLVFLLSGLQALNCVPWSHLFHTRLLLRSHFVPHEMQISNRRVEELPAWLWIMGLFGLEIQICFIIHFKISEWKEKFSVILTKPRGNTLSFSAKRFELNFGTLQCHPVLEFVKVLQVKFIPSIEFSYHSPWKSAVNIITIVACHWACLWIQISLLLILWMWSKICILRPLPPTPGLKLLMENLKPCSSKWTTTNKCSSGSSGRVMGGGGEKHEIYVAALGGHLFYELFSQGGHGPLPPPDPLLKCKRKRIIVLEILSWILSMLF